MKVVIANENGKIKHIFVQFSVIEYMVMEQGLRLMAKNRDDVNVVDREIAYKMSEELSALRPKEKEN